MSVDHHPTFCAGGNNHNWQKQVFQGLGLTIPNIKPGLKGFHLLEEQEVLKSLQRSLEKNRICVGAFNKPQKTANFIYIEWGQ